MAVTPSAIDPDVVAETDCDLIVLIYDVIVDLALLISQEVMRPNNLR